MSVLQASNLFASADRTAMAPNADERPQSEIWLNVGVMMKVIDPETGDEVEELLTLPVNLAIDTMKKREIPNRKPTTAKAKQYRDRAVASNTLLDAIQKAAGNLEPGATMALEGFSLQLQRVNAKEDEMAGTDPNDNVYLNQIAAAFGAKV